MCLTARRSNPLKGRHPIVFDEKGYVICWKVYRREAPFVRKKGLYPRFQYHKGEVKNGWIRSDRSGKIFNDSSDGLFSNHFNIHRGIHVYTSIHAAQRDASIYFAVVPVRCHESDLVAIDRDRTQAVFMKAFLKKADYVQALKG
jgi:hypothetical protein